MVVQNLVQKIWKVSWGDLLKIDISSADTVSGGDGHHNWHGDHTTDMGPRECLV